MGSNGPVVYDKGKYHLDTVEEYGLPESHAYHHTVYFFRWLLEQDLMSDEFRAETKFDKTAISNEVVLRIYEWWDTCLIDDMLSDEGNAFSQSYFDFDKGEYLRDYIRLLQGSLQSEFHIPLTEEDYQQLKPIIDRRYEQWKKRFFTSPRENPLPSSLPYGPSKPKRWWKFWGR